MHVILKRVIYWLVVSDVSDWAFGPVCFLQMGCRYKMETSLFFSRRTQKVRTNERLYCLNLSVNLCLSLSEQRRTRMSMAQKQIQLSHGFCCFTLLPLVLWLHCLCTETLTQVYTHTIQEDSDHNRIHIYTLRRQSSNPEKKMDPLEREPYPRVGRTAQKRCTSGSGVSRTWRTIQLVRTSHCCTACDTGIMPSQYACHFYWQH